jgi:hypothetical protein
MKSGDRVRARILSQEEMERVDKEVGLSPAMKKRMGQSGTVAWGDSHASYVCVRYGIDVWNWPLWAVEKLTPKDLEEGLPTPSESEKYNKSSENLEPALKEGVRVAVYCHDGRTTGMVKSYNGKGIYEVLMSNGNLIVAHEKQIRKLKKKESKIMWVYRDKLYSNPGGDAQNMVRVRVLK